MTGIRPASVVPLGIGAAPSAPAQPAPRRPAAPGGRSRAGENRKTIAVEFVPADTFP